MNHTDIINGLINKHKFNSYLEIGMDNPDHNFKKINCKTKHSVDPYFEDDHKPGYDISVEEFDNALKYLTHRMTSDEFFEQCEDKYDMIFIDGLHIEEQCGRDIINSLKHLNKGGYILVHDCLPIEEIHQKVPRESDWWNGDVWKCIPELEKQKIEFETIDCDCGCCIIKYKKNPETLKYLDKSKNTWNDYSKNRDKLMHVINEENFIFNYIIK